MRRQIGLIPAALIGWLATSAAFAEDRIVGPTIPGETLLSIARSLCQPNDARCASSKADTIYWANPQAFLTATRLLKADVTLRIPAALEMSEQTATTDGVTTSISEDSPSSPLPLREGLGGGVASSAAPATPSPALPSRGRESTVTMGNAATSSSKAPPSSPLPLREGPGGGVASSTAGDDEPNDLRRRAGEPVVTPPIEYPPLPDPNRISRLAPVAAPADAWKEYNKAPISDRWRLLDALGLIHERWYDPYHQNTLKGDKPVDFFGDEHDEFLSLSVINDLVYEYRRLPTPVGPQGTTDPNALDIFGGSRQAVWNENLILSGVYYKGDTTFKPPEYELHFTPVLNLNYAATEEAATLRTDPGRGRYRVDKWIGVQELFGDFHLRNVSDRYDFDSIRVGIQPFTSDFRGFLFQDLEPAIRLFGNRDNNRWQYNAIWIRRLEKNTNSGLNDIGQKPRNDDVYLFNLYHQDLPVLGFTSQVTIAHNRNREDGAEYYDDNGFRVRPAAFGTEKPRRYHVTYYGYNGDGHFGRLNLTASTYLAEGRQSNGDFIDGPQRIQSVFGAWEASMDFDWLRLRQSAIYSSGDHNPFNGTATGFDAIYENPLIAGADTSFWIRQAVPLIGGGGVALASRNGVLNDLRSSKDLGQSNFENPGLWLLGLGADADLLPELRLSGNFNHLWFDDPATLEVARNQGGISRDIGWDLSTALIWRPRFSQNIIFRLSGAMLLPGEGYRELFPDKTNYSVLANLVLAY